MNFKTNIKCDACVAKVTPALNKTVGEGNWEINLLVPERTLTINTDANIPEMVSALNEVGYTAEKV